MWRKNSFVKSNKKVKIKQRKKGKKIYLYVFITFIFLAGMFSIYFLIFNQTSIFISPLAKTKYQESIKLEEALSKANIKFVKTNPQSDFSFLVELIDKEEVIFSSKKDLQSQIASLQLITKRLTIEGKRFKRLDFRYDKPVIIF